MRKIAIKMAGLVFYMAAGFVLLFWKLECGGLPNAELLLPPVYPRFVPARRR